MTIPGHPDFQAAANTRTNTLFYNTVVQNLGINLQLFNNLAVSFRKLQATVVGADGYGNLVITTRGTPSGFLVENYTVPFGPNGPTSVRVPVSGQYVSLAIDNNKAGTLTSEVYACGLDTGNDHVEYVADQNEVIVPFTSVPGGGSTTVLQKSPQPGPAMFRTNPQDGTAFLAALIGELNLDGTKGPIFYEKFPVTASNADVVWLPPKLCYVEIDNTDAAAHSVVGALVPCGGYF